METRNLAETAGMSDFIGKPTTLQNVATVLQKYTGNGK